MPKIRRNLYLCTFTIDEALEQLPRSPSRPITERAFGRLKIRFRVLFRRCESNKETFKLYGLAGVAPHSLCIKHDKLAPRKFDLTLDHASNNPLSPEEVIDVLAL